MQNEAAIRIAGYAAVFDKRDRGGDIIRSGAFRRSLSEKRSLPLLWQHRSDSMIGSVEYIQEDVRGLRVIASIHPAQHRAPEAMRMLKAATVVGLSFGYRVRESRGSDPRQLLDVDLVEISLVTIPMQPWAQVHALIEQ